jgi:hypothetical protein
MFVHMHVCTYACMHICIYIHMYIGNIMLCCWDTSSGIEMMAVTLAPHFKMDYVHTCFATIVALLYLSTPEITVLEGGT